MSTSTQNISRSNGIVQMREHIIQTRLMLVEAGMRRTPITMKEMLDRVKITPREMVYILQNFLMLDTHAGSIIDGFFAATKPQYSALVVRQPGGIPGPWFWEFTNEEATTQPVIAAMDAVCKIFNVDRMDELATKTYDTFEYLRVTEPSRRELFRSVAQYLLHQVGHEVDPQLADENFFIPMDRVVTGSMGDFSFKTRLPGLEFNFYSDFPRKRLDVLKTLTVDNTPYLVVADELQKKDHDAILNATTRLGMFRNMLPQNFPIKDTLDFVTSSEPFINMTITREGSMYYMGSQIKNDTDADSSTDRPPYAE